jgi:hypothetical protein
MHKTLFILKQYIHITLKISFHISGCKVSDDCIIINLIYSFVHNTISLEWLSANNLVQFFKKYNTRSLLNLGQNTRMSRSSF